MTNSPASLFIGSAISLPSPSRISFVDNNNQPPLRVRQSVSERGGRSYGLSVNTEPGLYDAYTSSSNYPITPRAISISSPSEKDSCRFTDDNVSTGTTLVSPCDPSNYLPITPQFGPADGKLGTFSAINIILGKTVGVAIYSVPSSIFNSVGSVGASILLWIVGALISFCGLAVYLDLGSAIPRSGGERVYLERIFKKPRMLATCIFMSYVILLGFSTPNCIVLGEYVLYALEIEANRWNVRTIAVAVVTLLYVIHTRYQRLGLRIINVLGVVKMLILVIVILSGVAGALMRVGSIKSPLTRRRLSGTMDSFDLVSNPHLSTAQRNFSDMFAGSSTQPYDYAHALLKILYCFRGYSAVNSVLNEVRNPIPTLRIAAPVALSLVSVGYVLANIAYFLVVSKEDFRSSGVVIAGHFFKIIFGEVIGENVLPLFIIVSAFGNIAATAFAQARVNQELGKDGLLPFSSFFAGKNRWNSPTPGLFLHWLVSVIVIVVPPPGEIYNFLVDIGGYPASVISVAISLGLLYLQSSPSEHWQSPFRARKIYTIVFAASNILLLVLPWIKPSESKGDGRFPYYAYPATALAILGSGAVYWCWWAGFKQRSGGSIERSWVRRSKTTSGLDNAFPLLAVEVEETE